MIEIPLPGARTSAVTVKEDPKGMVWRGNPGAGTGAVGLGERAACAGSMHGAVEELPSSEEDSSGHEDQAASKASSRRGGTASGRGKGEVTQDDTPVAAQGRAPARLKSRGLVENHALNQTPPQATKL